ncbi:MAG: ATP-binding protein, partial [Planctomycetes bacterium]|nr:ATP-binding protein [Planctomycetota bacterium]
MVPPSPLERDGHEPEVAIADGRVRYAFVIPGDHLESVGRALQRLGIDCHTPGVVAEWVQGSRYAEGPVPYLVHALLETDDCPVELRTEGHGGAADPYVPCQFLKVVAEGDEAEAAAVRGVAEEFWRGYAEIQRLRCDSPGAFFGLRDDQDVDWSLKEFPRHALLPLNRGIEEIFAGWQHVADRPHGGSGVARAEVKTPDGRTHACLSRAVRYFRRGGEWAVVGIDDTTSYEGMVVVGIAVAGLPDGFPCEFLRRLEEYTRAHNIFRGAKITVAGEPLDLDRTYDWADLFVSEELKDTLRFEVETFFQRAPLYQEMGVPHRRGLLLAGDPGTGKTLFGKILACRLAGVTFLWATARDVGTPEGIHGAFLLARECAPAVLFFEDLDLYASPRGAIQSRSDTLGELLVQLDGMQENRGLLVVATTNDADVIEPALRERPSRFDRVISFPRPDLPVRRAHLGFLLGRFGVGPDRLDALAERTDGFTGAHIQELAVVARTESASRPGADGQITQADLDFALRAARQFSPGTVGFGAINSDDDNDRFDDHVRYPRGRNRSPPPPVATNPP